MVSKYPLTVTKLNLPEYQFRIMELNGRLQIFDDLRKKFVALTPEEWVRQNFLQYLIREKKYPQSLITVEGGLKLFRRSKRTDIVVFNNLGKPLLIVECKSPETTINQNVFDQVARYNMALEVKYLVLTNGMNHFICSIDYVSQSYFFLREIPEYSNL